MQGESIEATTEAARARADWRRVEQLYGQFSAIVNDPEKVNFLPNDVAGALAESLGRVLAHYDGSETVFLDDLFAIWSKIDGLNGSPKDRFRTLYLDQRLTRFPPYKTTAERRRPKAFETSVETVLRLIELNQVRDRLDSLPTGGILGGSLSYGRFFNVSGAIAGKSSDIDLLLVVPSYDLLKDVVSALRGIAGVDEKSLRSCEERLELFPRFREEHVPCIFSHKLRLWDTPNAYLDQYDIPSGYVLSIHAFSLDDFGFLTIRDLPILQANREETFVRDLFDYRDTEPSRRDDLRAFNGIDFSIPLESRRVEGGYVNRVRVCEIANERYCPGLHQNIILPQYEIRWQSPALRLYLPVLSFRWKLVERLNEERRLRPFEIQNLVLSHTRSAIFSPHIVKRASRE